MQTREDLKCLSIGKVYPMLKFIAERSGLSVSAWVRQIAIKEFRKIKEDKVTQVG